jgi:hypothetical protein
MRLLPAVKKKAPAGAVVGFLFIAFQQPTLKDKCKIGIFMKMPINLPVGIHGVGKGQAVQMDSLVCLPEKIPGP